MAIPRILRLLADFKAYSQMPYARLPCMELQNPFTLHILNTILFNRWWS
jgi:hypothetical protein